MIKVPTGPHHLPRPRKPLLSLSMIVKNGGQLFTELLAEAAPHVDEMVIGDTGSTDGSAEAARAAGARVVDIPWRDDFSHARNSVLERCRGRWILLLDHDEKLAPADWRALRHWVQEHRGARDHRAGIMVTRNYVAGHHAKRGWLPCPQPDPHALPGGTVAPGYVPSRKVRLFPNLPGIRFTGRLHETVEADLWAAGIKGEDLPWPVHHWGNLRENPAKTRYYLALARRKTREQPTRARAWSERADAAIGCGEREEAVEALERALALEPGDMERHLTLAWLLKEMGRPEQAAHQFRTVLETDDPDLLAKAGALLTLALRLNPGHGPQLNTLGVWHLRHGRGEEGRRALEKAAALLPDEADPRLNLAVLHAAANQLDQARAHVRQVLATQPQHPRARHLAQRLQMS